MMIGLIELLLLQTEVVRVVSVSDGDTVRIVRQNKSQATVRISGIDAPEKNQPYGLKSKAFASRILLGKVFTFRSSGKDKYGRLLGDFSNQDFIFSQKMVETGNAWWYRKYAANDKQLERCENSARKGRQGLWGESSPIAPWDWRHGGAAKFNLALAKRKK